MNNKIFLIIAILYFVFLPGRISFARQIRGVLYPVEKYSIVGSKIGTVKVDDTYSFGFPVSVSNHHVSCYLWVKRFIEEGRLSKGMPLIYLDAHLDHFIGKTWTIQSSNWVRAVLNEELCSSATLILPEWIYEDINMVYRVKLYDTVGEIQRLYQHQLNISELGDLALAKKQHAVVLSIDCDYFSNMGFPQHRVSRREITEEIQRVVSVLKAKNIKIMGLNIAISPGYTYQDQESFIKDELLKAFSDYEN